MNPFCMKVPPLLPVTYYSTACSGTSYVGPVVSISYIFAWGKKKEAQ